MSRALRRPITPPFVVAPPAGARVRTRLHVDETDAQVLEALGQHLGSLASRDLAARCSEGLLDATERAQSRRERKRALTARSSSRWAGAITRTSEDAWRLAFRNLQAERASLRSRIRTIEKRLAIPAGKKKGRTPGYPTPAECHAKTIRLQVLRRRLAGVEQRLTDGKMSICRGGRRRARVRHNLDAAGLKEEQWRERFIAERLFICADGEKDKVWGNETIRWHPMEHWLELKLPAPLAHLANQRHGRYRLSCTVTFAHRGDEVAAQALSGAIRYDVIFDAVKHRSYLDASWKLNRAVRDLDELRGDNVLAVDLNHGHLATAVLDPSGNPVGAPQTIPLELDDLLASTRDGRIRGAIAEMLALAERHGARAVVIENLDFADQRANGNEHIGGRPSRGKRGRSFRRMIAGLPTATFRDRLVQMATNRNLAVIAIDPAYTSKWGAEHWLSPLHEISPEMTGHHAAAVVIGRRGLGHRARRRGRCDSTRAAHRGERATNSVASGAPSSSRSFSDRPAAGQRRLSRETPLGGRPPGRDHPAQDRSEPAVGAVFQLLPR